MRVEAQAFLDVLRAGQEAAPAPTSMAELRQLYEAPEFVALFAGDAPDLADRQLITVPGAEGELQALLQRPLDAVEPSPVLAYFHGGGFGVGSCLANETMTAWLAALSGCTVVSVDYRLAPEHPFPAAHDDARAVLRWVGEGAPGLGVAIDSTRVAVGGDSAGAALALWSALDESRRARPGVVALVLFYGWYVLSLDTPTMRSIGPTDPVIPLPLMQLFQQCLIGDAKAGVSEVDVVDTPLPVIADACLLVGDADPLLADSEQLADNLRRCGSAVELHVFGGMPHGFAMVRSITDARRSIDVAATFLRSRTQRGAKLDVDRAGRSSSIT
jgi:acetyl esterase